MIVGKLLVAAALALALAGCAAESVQVKINQSDLVEALAGKAVEVPFEATFSILGNLDGEQRGQIETLEAVARKYISIEDFSLSKGDYNTEITVEGTLRLTYRTAEPSQAWVIAISDVDDNQLKQVFPYEVQLVTGGAFERFTSEAKAVNFMLAPDSAQPIRFRLKADEGQRLRLLAGGFETDGTGQSISLITVQAGESVSLQFKGGAYESIGGGFLFSLEQYKMAFR